MHESHHPHVHGKSWTALVLELAMIGVGVFLGLQADQWRESRQHREAALVALENFRTELHANRTQVAAVQPYHERLGRAFYTVQADPAHPPPTLDALFTRVRWDGMHPVAFRHTAWDLALANQSLGFIEPRLAFSIADAYTTQRKLEEFQQTTLQNSLSPSSLSASARPGLVLTLMVFLSDAGKSQEPALLRQYDILLPRLDSAVARLEK